jgi:soluble lytic murein transglycosylase-like protein
MAVMIAGVLSLPIVSRVYLKTEQKVRQYSMQLYQSGLNAMGLQPIPSEATFNEMIDRAAERHRVPKALVHSIAVTESAKNPEATSKSGARGIMQVMPFNASRCGIEPYELYNPKLNIECGVKILAENLKNNSVPNALCLYNSGKPCSKSSPQETKDYLVKVLENLPMS